MKRVDVQLKYRSLIKPRSKVQLTLNGKKAHCVLWLNDIKSTI